MKKTFFAVLAGIAVASSAMAAPECKVAVVPERRLFVGETFALEFEIPVEKGCSIEQLSAHGAPEAGEGFTLEGQENLPDGQSPDPACDVKRFRLVYRALAPRSISREVSLWGMQSRTTRTRFGISTHATGIHRKCGKIAVNVDPLPEAGKPEGFSGAVGTRFDLASRFEEPEKGWPGRWSRAIYTVDYDGWIPDGAMPRVSLPYGKFVKIHDPVVAEKDPGRRVWRQTMMPADATSTAGPSLELAWFDTSSRQYRKSVAPAAPLAFKRPARKSGPPPEIGLAPEAAEGKTALRLGPSDASPILAILENGAGCRTLSEKGCWRRVETPAGTGWIKTAGGK